MNINLDLIKKHLNLCDSSEDDDYLLMLLFSAQEHLKDFVGCDYGNDVPAPLALGVLMLVAHWYEHRESATERALSEIPSGTYRLWMPYVNYFEYVEAK